MVDVAENLSCLNGEDKIAVALSGGGDSMALAHMVCHWAHDHHKQIVLLSVDHNLRPESAQELQDVSQWVSQFPNQTHHILTWQFDEKPQQAIMEQARRARYDLMTQYCIENAIKTLCVAHHADDQAETFFFRLAKGSGLDGLASMNAKTNHDGVTIFRPLLGQSHQDLVDYCTAHDLKWIEDPSNENTNYARPRLRQALANEGLDAKRLSKTVERIARAREALEWMTDETVKCVWDRDAGILDWGALQDNPKDIQIRVMVRVLGVVGQTQNGYPPKLERVEEMVEQFAPLKSQTLYGCLLTMSKTGQHISVKLQD